MPPKSDGTPGEVPEREVFVLEILKKRPGDNIFVVQGEKKILFDLSKWEARFGREGRAELLYRRPGESAYYPVSLEREGSTAVWAMTAADTAKEGTGRAELRYYMGECLVYSLTSDITVEHPLDEAGEAAAPPGQSWLDRVLEAARRAEDAAEQAVEDVVKDGRIVQAVEDHLAGVKVATQDWVAVQTREKIQSALTQASEDWLATKTWTTAQTQEKIQSALTQASEDWLATKTWTSDQIRNAIQAAINATWEASY